MKSKKEEQTQQSHYLMTNKFTDKTFMENIIFREKFPKIGCIYGAPLPITKTIELNTVLFVLEMNITTNMIEGIGMLKLHTPVRGMPLYTNGNYNRYIYHGKHRISRNEMNYMEEELMCFFDKICFYGRNHLKCIQGILKFPPKIIENCCNQIDLLDFIKGMFKKRLNNKNQLVNNI